MRHRFLLLPLMAAVAVGAPALAQQWPDSPGAQQDAPPAAKQKAKAKAKARRDVDDTQELSPSQIQRAQEQPDLPADGDMPKAVKRAPAKAAPARTIACSGAFGKDSSHIRLAQEFGTQNIAFAEVEGPNNTKLMASVVFPKDPQRRIEVLWRNNTSRTGLQVIAINGKSGWSAPRGLRLGMQLAAIEKINGKPFTITGFGTEGASTADWQGGALSKLPGDCKMGLRLTMDQRAPQEARTQAAAAKELQSSEPGARAVRASVVEILIGY